MTSTESAMAFAAEEANQFIAFNILLDIHRMSASPVHRNASGIRHNTTSCTFYDDQCEDLVYSPQNGSNTSFKRSLRCDEIVAAMPNRPKIEYGGERAFYIPMLDTVTIPDPECFESPEYFYSVLFHELVHSTGHESRLDRIPITNAMEIDSPILFAREELVAEMGSALLCGYAGIENKVIEKSIEYMESHENDLEGDSRVLMYAVGASQRAAEYILGET